jgi:hypothetical protein
MFTQLGGDVAAPGAAGTAPVSQSTTGLLGDIFGFSATPTSYSPPKTNWLPAEKGKGLDIWGTFSRRYILHLTDVRVKVRNSVLHLVFELVCKNSAHCRVCSKFS